MSLWYIQKEGERADPVTAEQLREKVHSGELQPDDLIKPEGREAWVKAHRVRGLFAPQPRPEPMPQAEPQSSIPPPKNDANPFGFEPSDDPKHDFVAQLLRREARKAVWSLVAIAVLYLLSFAFVLILMGDHAAVRRSPQSRYSLWSCLAMSFLFVGLAIWAERSPFWPAMVGLSLFGLDQLLVVLLLGPLYLLSGWWIKLLIVGGLIAGITSGRSYERRLQRLESGDKPSTARPRRATRTPWPVGTAIAVTIAFLLGFAALGVAIVGPALAPSGYDKIKVGMTKDQIAPLIDELVYTWEGSFQTASFPFRGRQGDGSVSRVEVSVGRKKFGLNFDSNDRLVSKDKTGF